MQFVRALATVVVVAIPSGGVAAACEAQSGANRAAHYVAVAENGLHSQIRAGENGGRRLSHDHVVRFWIGPLSLHGGSIELERSVLLAETWQRARLEVSAFVQEQARGRVLQAVGVRPCGIAEGPAS
jgi:hypothetical protein